MTTTSIVRMGDGPPNGAARLAQSDLPPIPTKMTPGAAAETCLRALVEESERQIAAKREAILALEGEIGRMRAGMAGIAAALAALRRKTGHAEGHQPRAVRGATSLRARAWEWIAAQEPGRDVTAGAIVVALGSGTSRAQVNTLLAGFAAAGRLERTALGVYRRTEGVP